GCATGAEQPAAAAAAAAEQHAQRARRQAAAHAATETGRPCLPGLAARLPRTQQLIEQALCVERHDRLLTLNRMDTRGRNMRSAAPNHRLAGRVLRADRCRSSAKPPRSGISGWRPRPFFARPSARTARFLTAINPRPANLASL